jgi:hypothetical protein
MKHWFVPPIVIPALLAVAFLGFLSFRAML